MKDNSRDMIAKGRDRYVTTKRGQAHANAKLTWEAVRRIRGLRASGMQAKTLAAEYGVTGALISYVCTNKGWKE